jgi:hypothetical protein
MPSKHFSEIVSACCVTPEPRRHAPDHVGVGDRVVGNPAGPAASTSAPPKRPAKVRAAFKCRKAEHHEVMPIAFDAVAPRLAGEFLGERADG